MALTLTYDPQLSRVRLTATGLSLNDAFTRTVSSGWGTSDTGHVWATDGGSASNYLTTGSRGAHSATARGTSYITYAGPSVVDVDITARVVVGVLATGGYISPGLVARFTSSAGGYYLVRAEFNPDQSISLTAFRRTVADGFTSLLAVPITRTTHSTGAGYSMRLQVVGARVRARFWMTSAGEPSVWDIDVTDTAPVLTPGQGGARSFLSSSNTNTLPVSVEYDDVSAVPFVEVQRSTDLVRWSTVRGGAGLVPAAGAVSVDDYEFTPDVANTYRVVGQTGSITPTLDRAWLKSIARPFLNRPVTVVDYSDSERPSRAGVFDVVGRSLPVSVSDVRGSRRWTLEVLAGSLDEADDLDLLLASGDSLLIQVPAGSGVPAGYVEVGDTRQRRTSRLGPRRVFELPCTEVAAPGPDVVGSTVTWQTVLNTYPTWQAVMDAHPTWQSLMELIGDPSEVIVP